MEKIIFLGLVIPILAFVFYLGGTAIMKGFKAKENKKSTEMEDHSFSNSDSDDEQLSDELVKLNQLYEKGILTKEEFERAKKKILDN